MQTCEAVIAQFIWGPEFCRDDIVHPIIDPYTGETLWTCDVHDPELNGDANQ